MNFYDENAKTFIENTINLDMSEFYNRFEKHTKGKTTLLDVGCGPGRDLKYFANKFDVTGVEPSSVLAEYAKSYAGVPVYNSTLEELKTSKCYDMIWACASLLHIPRASLPQAFVKIYEHLNLEGIVYCSFKYGTKEEIRDIRHFTDMNRQLLELVIEESSLSISDFWLSQDVRPGRENEKWTNAILKK